jgi:hypothetical protein
MTTLAKSKTLLPTWTGSLFDNGRLLSPRMLDLNTEFLPWDYVDRIPYLNSSNAMEDATAGVRV